MTNQNKETVSDPVAPDALGALSVSAKPPSSSNEERITSLQQFIPFLSRKLRRIKARNGKVYVVKNNAENLYVELLGSHKIENIIRDIARSTGFRLSKADLREIIDHLRADAETNGTRTNVYYRVAPIQGGIEIDLGDEAHTRVRITAGKVEIVNQGSKTLFYRTQVSGPMVMPAARGDLGLLDKYLNLHLTSIMLFKAWLSYTLAHPKISTSNFVILVLHGNQGSGKSWLSRVIRKLIDPSQIAVQMSPAKVSDLAISAQNAHCLIFDNVRAFTPMMADSLCVAATGGTICTRQLYTDDSQQILHLHVALVLNGIHSFIDQPDLAQRCLPLDLLPISESERKSEVELNREFCADLPAIQRGLFDLIANIMIHLPTVEVTNPERMIDFVKWLAAMEKVDGIPPGIYQAEYSYALSESQLNSLLENSLAAAVIEFAKNLTDGKWSGTPAELLDNLNSHATLGTQRSKDWPQNAIALSKRLMPLQTALQTQNIGVELSRGKHRTITITNLG